MARKRKQRPGAVIINNIEYRNAQAARSWCSAGDPIPAYEPSTAVMPSHDDHASLPFYSGNREHHAALRSQNYLSWLNNEIDFQHASKARAIQAAHDADHIYYRRYLGVTNPAPRPVINYKTLERIQLEIDQTCDQLKSESQVKLQVYTRRNWLKNYLHQLMQMRKAERARGIDAAIAARKAETAARVASNKAFTEFLNKEFKRIQGERKAGEFSTWADRFRSIQKPKARDNSQHYRQTVTAGKLSFPVSPACISEQIIDLRQLTNLPMKFFDSDSSQFVDLRHIIAKTRSELIRLPVVTYYLPVVENGASRIDVIQRIERFSIGYYSILRVFNREAGTFNGVTGNACCSWFAAGRPKRVVDEYGAALPAADIESVKIQAEKMLAKGHQIKDSKAARSIGLLLAEAKKAKAAAKIAAKKSAPAATPDIIGVIPRTRQETAAMVKSLIIR